MAINRFDDIASTRIVPNSVLNTCSLTAATESNVDMDTAGESTGMGKFGIQLVLGLHFAQY